MIKGYGESSIRLRVVKMHGADAAYSWTDLNQTPEALFHSGEWTEESAPKWVRESMILMNLMDESTELEGVGYRHSENVFYLTIKGSIKADNNGESHE